VASFSWIAGHPGTYVSSSHAKRSFCQACGSYLAFQSTEFPDEVSVNTALFDSPEAFPPRKHIFAETRIAWFCTADGLPVYPDYGPSRPVGE
jgi:hypothetical protein